MAVSEKTSVTTVSQMYSVIGPMPASLTLERPAAADCWLMYSCVFLWVFCELTIEIRTRKWLLEFYFSFELSHCWSSFNTSKSNYFGTRTVWNVSRTPVTKLQECVKRFLRLTQRLRCVLLVSEFFLGNPNQFKYKGFLGKEQNKEVLLVQ